MSQLVILHKLGPISTWKLQKLAYYCQAWSLVWDERPLFSARIEAWANGPVVPALYRLHRGQFKVTEWPHGDCNALKAFEKETVNAVLKFYGNKPSQWLTDLNVTSREEPWRKAREGLLLDEPGHREITIGDMADYYGKLK